MMCCALPCCLSVCLSVRVCLCMSVVQLPAAVTSMSLNRKGDLLVMACSDKVLRLADVQPRPQDAKPVSMEEAQLTLSTLGVSTCSNGHVHC